MNRYNIYEMLLKSKLKLNNQKEYHLKKIERLKNQLEEKIKFDQFRISEINKKIANINEGINCYIISKKMITDDNKVSLSRLKKTPPIRISTFNKVDLGLKKGGY